MDEPRCYNCGMSGHQTVACPEATRTVPAGLEEHRRRQATATDFRHKNRGKHYASSSSTSSQSRHSNGMVVTRYPLPPSAGEPQITRYPPPHQMPHLPPPPPMSLLPPPPPPPSAAGGAYHGYHPQHHALPPHPPPPQRQPAPEPWTYPPPPQQQQPTYAGPHSSAPPPPHYPHYDSFGQPLDHHAPHPGPAADSSFYSQSYPPQPGYFAAPPSGVTGPPRVIPPPSFAPGPYFAQPSHLSHPLPPAPRHQQPPSGPRQPGASEPYAQHDFGRQQPPSYQASSSYGSPPSTLPSTPKYPQGSGSSNGWRPGKRGGDFGGQYRGGRGFLGRDRGRRQQPNGGFRHGASDHAVGAPPSIPTGPAALSRRFAPAASASASASASGERRAPPPLGDDAAAVAAGIPAKPPTPISMSRLGPKRGGRAQEAAARRAEPDQTSSQSSPNTLAGSENQDPCLPSQKRTGDSRLAVDDDRGTKRTRPSPSDRPSDRPTPPSRQSATPVGAAGTVGVSDTPTGSPYANDGKRRDEDGTRTRQSPPAAKNSLPNRVLSYGTSDRESSGASTRHDSGYHSNDGVEPLLAASKSSAAATGVPTSSNPPSLPPASSRGHSRSHSRGRSHSHSHSQSQSHSHSHSQSHSRSRSHSRGRSPVRHMPDSPPADSHAHSRRGCSGFSRSRSSSPLDDLELAMLGMVRPESEEENGELQKSSEKSGGSQKIRKRQQPRVAAAYSRRW